MTPGDLAELEQRARLSPSVTLRRELEATYLKAGLCACGCREPLPSTKRGRRYINERHRQRSYEQRLEAAAAASGTKLRAALRDLEVTESTGSRQSDASARRQPRQKRKRPGVSLYLPRPELLDLVESALERAIEDLADADPEHLGALEEARAAASKARDRRDRKALRS